MDDQKAAAELLRQRYFDEVDGCGGDLEVKGSKRWLSASVTWRDSNIYDHIDIDLQEQQLAQAFALVKGQIQEWIREGPPRTA